MSATELEVVEEFVAAFAERDEPRLVATMHADALLDGPFPIGKKSGAAKAAGALLNVGRLGVKIGPPADAGGGLQADIRSPAGAMLLKFTVAEGRITRLDVEKP